MANIGREGIISVKRQKRKEEEASHMLQKDRREEKKKQGSWLAKNAVARGRSKRRRREKFY